jgi:hypothetical protein
LTPWVSHQFAIMRHIRLHTIIDIKNSSLSLDRDSTRPRGIGPALLDSARPVEGVLGERTSQCLLARDLLAADEAVYGNGDGTIDVVCAAVLGQSHLGESF